MSERVRVFIADDHPVFLDGLERQWLADDAIEVVGSTGDGLDALKEIRRLEPDVAILDLRLPGADGIQILERLNELEVPTRVVILTAYVDSSTVYRALGAGARGFLEKATSADDITAAVLSVARGGVVIPPFVGGMLADEMRTRTERAELPVLSARELDVLRLAADGASAQQIARRLTISVTTVRTHFAHIYQKLEVADRAAAVAVAIRRGMLS